MYIFTPGISVSDGVGGNSLYLIGGSVVVEVVEVVKVVEVVEVVVVGPTVVDVVSFWTYFVNVTFSFELYSNVFVDGN